MDKTKIIKRKNKVIMKKAIAMKCTQKDWDSIKNRIPEERIKNLESRIECITNIYEGNKISNIGFGDGTYRGNKIHETFSAKIFLEACGIEVEQKFEITKEQILELYSAAKPDGRTEKNLKEWFPDALKKELEVGKWYKVDNGRFVYLILYSGEALSLGFYNNKWGNWAFTKNSNQKKAIEATPQEVEAALIAEAKKRGFEDGVKYRPISKIGELEHDGYLCNGQFVYNALGNCLHAGMQYIFDNGKWETIIQPEKMTLEQIEKELGRKIQII